MKKIQMTEEQAKTLVSDCVGFYQRVGHILDICSLQSHFLSKMKQKGYIKKSDFEKAREKYLSIEKTELQYIPYVDYIIELEKEIERLKNEK